MSFNKTIFAFESYLSCFLLFLSFEFNRNSFVGREIGCRIIIALYSECFPSFLLRYLKLSQTHGMRRKLYWTKVSTRYRDNQERNLVKFQFFSTIRWPSVEKLESKFGSGYNLLCWIAVAENEDERWEFLLKIFSFSWHRIGCTGEHWGSRGKTKKTSGNVLFQVESWINIFSLSSIRTSSSIHNPRLSSITRMNKHTKRRTA